jgi:spoIIIJ-associated protein
MTEKRANLEIIAPTVEEAIEEGLGKLGLTEDAVDIEILDEGTKGLFGIGSRQTRIRLTVKNYSTEITKEFPNIHPGEHELDSDLENSETGDEEDHVLKISRETVSDLLKKMKISADVSANRGEPDDERSLPPIHVDIQGDDLSILIGRKAETLNALQFITKLIIGKEIEKSIPLTIDVEGYRKRRDQQIRQLATRVAVQVNDSKHSQALEPMSPYERRIVHIELRNDANVYTESVGEGQRRKVVIHPEE